jgi:hypothetical protein
MAVIRMPPLPLLLPTLPPLLLLKLLLALSFLDAPQGGGGCQASYSNRQRAAMMATSTAAVAAASMATAVSAAATLPLVDEYLFLVESPRLDSGGHKDASDDSGYCIIVQSGNPSLTPLSGHVHRRMLGLPRGPLRTMFNCHHLLQCA